MHPQSAVERVSRAHACLRRAIENWNGADLSQVVMARQLLEESVSELEQVPVRLRDAAPAQQDDLYCIVSDLKRDIVHLTRVIDTCAAFYRGLGVRLGDSAPTYAPAGRTVASTGPAPGGFEG